MQTPIHIPSPRILKINLFHLVGLPSTKLWHRLLQRSNEHFIQYRKLERNICKDQWTLFSLLLSNISNVHQKPEIRPFRFRRFLELSKACLLTANNSQNCQLSEASSDVTNYLQLDWCETATKYIFGNPIRTRIVSLFTFSSQTNKRKKSNICQVITIFTREILGLSNCPND